MKTKLSFTMLFVFLLSPFSFFLSSAQVPQGFNYQAIARDIDGKELANKSIQVKLTIKPDSSGTGIIWEELHNPVITNAFGLFTVVLGKGSRQGTSTVPAFSGINWSGTQLFIKTQVYYQSTWYNMGVTRLWSVPYAMSSGNISGSLKKLQVTGTEASLDSALFEVRNKDGQIVFAVYNEGVRVYVDDGDLGKGKKGGFAIGSFSKAKGYDDYFIVTGDSIRAYIDTGMVKARKGGFAIGSFSKAKAGREEYMRVTRDSTRVYIDDTGAKALKGGFAIGGFEKAKGIDSKYLSVSPSKTNVSVSDSLKGFSITSIQGGANSDFMNINKVNYAIGHESGLKTVPNFSSFLGRYNVFFGYKSGFNNITGYGNVFIGHETGFNTSTGSYNVYMGYMSGKNNIGGSSNLFMGYQSGNLSTGSYDVYLGQGAGQYNGVGERNTYIGTQSGIEDGKYVANPSYPPGNDNVFIGYRAGAKHWTGNTNTYIGASAGENKFGNGRVFIGYRAGYNETTNNKLYIENSESASPLVWGDFTANKIKIWGDLEYTGVLTGPSDIRLKHDLQPLSGSLEKIIGLRSYYFFWTQGLIPDFTFSDSRQVGLVAQDVEKYFPEIVYEGQNGFKTIEYSKIGVLLIPAVKELYDSLQSSEKEIKELRSEVEALKSMIRAIEANINSSIK